MISRCAFGTDRIRSYAGFATGSSGRGGPASRLSISLKRLVDPCNEVLGFLYEIFGLPLERPLMGDIPCIQVACAVGAATGMQAVAERRKVLADIGAWCSSGPQMISRRDSVGAAVGGTRDVAIDHGTTKHSTRHAPPHVALIVETSTAFGRRLLQGIGHYVRENGPWSIYLEQRSIYDPAPPWLKNWDGNGIISRAAYPEIAKLVLGLRIPTVDLNEQVTGLGLPLIFNDHRKIGQLAAEHLLHRGFRHFGFIGHSGIYWSDERQAGFAETVARAGSQCESYQGKGKTLRRYHQRSWEKEMDWVGKWVSGLAKPTGIMACNDFRAFQLLDACRRVGVAVPEQVAVIGVDDEDVAGELAHPPLSSVVPNAMHIGYEAAAMLDALMRGEQPSQNELFVPPVGVVTRKSTDVMAIDDAVVAEALRFIRRHACAGIKVDEVLRHLLISRSVLQRRFRQEVGKSIHEAILEQRLERVKELLAQTTLSRTQIADRCGFKHGEYMSTMFKQHVGLSLTDYRREHGLPGS